MKERVFRGDGVELDPSTMKPMTKKSKIQEMNSDCCNADCIVKGEDGEGTFWSECEKCGKDCNPVMTDNELDEILENICWVFEKTDGELIVESDGLTPEQAKQKLLAWRNRYAQEYADSVIGKKPTEDVVTDSGIGFSEKQFNNLTRWEEQRQLNEERKGRL